MLLPRFDLVDLLDRMQVYRIDREAIEGVGRQGNDVALLEAGDDVFDAIRLWFVGMNPQNLRRQVVYLGSLIFLRMRGKACINLFTARRLRTPVPSPVLYPFPLAKSALSRKATIA